MKNLIEVKELMVEEHVYNLLPGYALGCLDEDELIQVARHLPQCAICRGELETFWSLADQLALAAVVKVPPPQLKEKIMARVEPRPAAAAARPVRRREEGSWRQRLAGLFPRLSISWVTAVALLLAVFLGVSNLMLWRQVNDLQARVPVGDMKVVHLAGTPNAPQAQGYLMIFANEGYGTLVVEDAPALQAGYQYQLWLVRDGKRTSGGVFSVNEWGYGTLQIWNSQPLNTYPSFGVTIEPEGGSPGPTGSKVLGTDL